MLFCVAKETSPNDVFVYCLFGPRFLRAMTPPLTAKLEHKTHAAFPCLPLQAPHKAIPHLRDTCQLFFLGGTQCNTPQMGPAGRTCRALTRQMWTATRRPVAGVMFWTVSGRYHCQTLGVVSLHGKRMGWICLAFLGSWKLDRSVWEDYFLLRKPVQFHDWISCVDL